MDFIGEKLRLLRKLDGAQWLSVFFAIWLFLAVLAPDSVYKHFFHVAILPLALYLLVSRKQRVDWKDPFLALFLSYCVYMSISTWLVANTPLADNVQASRWGVEASLGMLAFFLWMRSVVRTPDVWGVVFLMTAVFGALAGLLSVPVGEFFIARLEGIGAAGHAIQGASVLIVLLAVGTFCLFEQSGSEANRKAVTLGVIAFFLVSLFVLLTKSRAPIAALIVYVCFTVLLAYLKGRSKLLFVIVSAMVMGLVGLVHGIFGIPELMEQLASRGDSYRLHIWSAYIHHPPESILFGNGAGLDFEFTDPHQVYLASRGLDIVHPHSIWLGAYAETGLLGLAMQLGFLLLLVWSVLRCPCTMAQKLHLFMIVGLFFLLTFTDEYTLLISVQPIWIFGWIPLVFVWVWSRYKYKDSDGRVCFDGVA